MGFTDLRDVPIHPEFPTLLWAVVERPTGEPFRVVYEPESG